MPLLFCGAILLILALFATFTPDKPQVEGIAPELEREAAAIKIDLDTEAGSAWKKRILDAGSGFVGAEEKNRKLMAVSEAAIAAKAFDAACTAIVLMRDGPEREAMLEKLFAQAVADCKDLAWGVFAIHGLRDETLMRVMTQALDNRWRECQKQK